MQLRAVAITCNNHSAFVTTQPVAKYDGDWHPVAVVDSCHLELTNGRLIGQDVPWYVFCSIVEMEEVK